MNTNKLKLFLRKIPKFLISLFVEMLEEKTIMNIFSRKLFCLPLCQLLEVQISVHENSHYPFPEESKNIHTRKWDADQYFQTGKCYISVVAHCCALQLTDISVSETGLRFILCQYVVCKRYKITFTDIDVAVCSRTYRYFEIKTKLWIR